MSDLDAARGPATTSAAAVNSLARRLHPTTGGAIGPAHDVGMLDAFAEVFAQMAAANPTPLQRPADPPAAEPTPQPRSDRDGSEESASESSERPTVRYPHSQLHDEIAGRKPPDWECHVEPDRPESPIPGDPPVEYTNEQDVSPEPEPLIDTTIVNVHSVNSSETRPSGIEVVAPERTPDAAEHKGVEKVHQVAPTSNAGNSADTPTETELSAPTDMDAAAQQSTTSGVSGEDDGRRRSRDRHHRSDATPAPAEQTKPDQAAQAAAHRERAVGPAADVIQSDAADPGTPSTETRGASETVIAGVSPVSGAVGRTGTARAAGGPRAPIQGLASSTPAQATGDSKPPTSDSSDSSTRTADAVNRAKLIQRVSKAFQHLGPNGGVVRLRLAPAELGTVRIEMRVDGRNVNARVVAETEAAASQLREHLPDLRSRLESYGMQIERLDVETESSDADRGNQHHWADGDRGQQDQAKRHQQRLPPSHVAATSKPHPLPAAVAAGQPINTALGHGVDLRI